MDSVLETLFKEAQNYIATERKSLQEARELADGIANAEVARLKQQNVLLIRLLESEKLKADRAGEDLKQKIATLVSAFTADRDRSLREAFSEMADSNTSAEKEMNKLAQQQGQQLDGVQQIGAEWGLSVERRRSEAKRTRDGGLKVCLMPYAVLLLSVYAKGCLSVPRGTFFFNTNWILRHTQGCWNFICSILIGVVTEDTTEQHQVQRR